MSIILSLRSFAHYRLGRRQWRASSTRPAIAARPRLRPCLEALEDRITPTTFTPTTFADDGSANSLRGVITQANNDTGTATDTIQLAAGTYKLTLVNSSDKHEQANLHGDLNITNTKHALVIQGAVDANGNPTTTIQQTVADRVFQIVNPGISVTFKDVIIEGGTAQDAGGNGTTAGSTKALGGGILANADNVLLSNVVLQINSADAGAGFDADGGGIYAGAGGTLIVQSSSLAANSAFGGAADAADTAGGIAEGGGIYTSCPTTIVRSNLSGNTVTGGNSNNNKDGDTGGNAEGGGIYVGTDGTADISNSIMAGNTVTGGAGDTLRGGDALGGGIYANGQTAVTDSNLSGNTLKGGSSSGGNGGDTEGGGVYASFETTITASTLSDNALIGGDGNLSNNINDGSNNGGAAFGGGIFVNGQGTADITASTLSNNTLTGGNGSINNSSAIVGGNVGGSAEGGGVYDRSSTSNPTSISTSILSGNTLTGGNGNFVSGTVKGNLGGSASGGGVFASDVVVTINASTLSDNTATGGNAQGGTVAPGTAKGGGAFVIGSDFELVNSTVAENQVIGGQGTSNKPVASGGGLFFGIDGAGDKTTATLTNVTVAGNQASLPKVGTGTTVGGGIDNDSGTVTLVNTLVALNSAATGPDYAGPVSTGSGHNLIGNADGSTGFSAALGDLLGSTANPLDPKLGGLQNNGGPTPTLSLLPGSPALNAGDNSAQSVTGPFDQRGQGFVRVAGGTIDIGAFEVQPPPPPPPSSAPPSPAPPPTLHTPPLLAFFDSLLAGVETVNSNGTETMIDSLFGIPLFISIYDGAGNLMSVTLFGIDVTFLFESL